MENTAKEKRLRKILREIVVNEPYTIRAAVAKEAFCYNNIEDFFNDLAKSGCISGMAGSLVFYNQTHQFYDHHYDEIEELREEFLHSGIELKWPDGDLKNWFAWLAFEEIAYRMTSDDLGLEI